MARYDFGGTLADFVVTSRHLGGLDVLGLSAATLTFWSAQTGGTKYTDLVLNGSAASSISVGTDGQVPKFQGPDGITEMWADGGSPRVRVVTLQGAPGPAGKDGTNGLPGVNAVANDTATGGYVGTLGSATRAALDAAYTQLTSVAATVTASATLTANRHTPVDATSAPRTMTLPTSPAGTLISVEKTDASTNAVNVTGTLRGVASSTIPLAAQYDTRTFLSEGGGSWRPISDHRTSASLSAAFAPAAGIVYAGTFRDGVRTPAQILTAAAAAVSPGGVIRLEANQTYTLTSLLTLTLSGKDGVVIDGQGATIDGTAVSGIILRVAGTSTSSTTLTASLTGRSDTLSVASTTGFAAGQLVKLSSSGEPGNPERLADFKSEVGIVAAVVDGTTLRLRSRTWDTYSTSGNTVTVSRYDPVRNVKIRNLTIRGAGNATDQTGLQVIYFDGAVVSEVNTIGCGTEGIAIATGISATVKECTATGPNLSGVGYGFHVTDAQTVRISNCYGRINRHSFDADRARDIAYLNNTAEGDAAAGFSTHGTTSVVKMIGNTVKDCGGGMIARGSRHTIDNNEIIGSRSTADSAESYQHGITIGDDGTHTWGVGLAGQRLRVTNNRIDLTGPTFVGDTHGIYCTAMLVDAEISGNYIAGYTVHAIYSKGDGGVRSRISRNTCDGSAQVGTSGVTASHGIFLSPTHAVIGNLYSDIVIDENRITSALYHGIRVRGGFDSSAPSTDIVIRRNRIGACGVAPAGVSDGFYGKRIEVAENQWLALTSGNGVPLAAASNYQQMPYVAANGDSGIGVRVLSDGMQIARLRSGLRYGPMAGSVAANALSADTLRTAPIFINRRVTISELGINVTVAAAGSAVRMGIYADIDDGVGGYPGALVAGSEVSVASTAVAFAAAPISVVLEPGLYWLAAASQGGAPTVNAVSGPTPLIGYQAAGSLTTRSGYIQAGVTGALPSTFSTSVDANGPCPQVQMKVA